MNWYMTVLKRYAEFEGRASRSEYWYFNLFHTIVAIITMVLDTVLLASMTGGIPVLTVIYVLATLLPSLAVMIRRLHDTGRSGWWFLIAFIPLASLALIVFFVFDSQPGDNQYGPNPKGVTA